MGWFVWLFAQGSGVSLVGGVPAGEQPWSDCVAGVEDETCLEREWSRLQPAGSPVLMASQEGMRK